MELNLPVFAYGGYSHSVSQQLPKLGESLKEVPYKLPRRADRLTQLSMLGLANLPNCEKLDRETHLVLATGDANLSSTIANNEQIFESGSTPTPIGFINTVNNSTAFHICVTLGIQGQAITLSRDHCSLEAAIQTASTLQHSSESPILLGTADEIPKDTHQHRRRLNLSDDALLAEGSFWFQCGHAHNNLPAIATIKYCGPMANFEAVAGFFSARQITHHLLGDLIQDSPLKQRELPGQRVDTLSRGHYLTQNAYYLQNWLDNAQPGERLGMLNGSVGTQRLSVTLIEKH